MNLGLVIKSIRQKNGFKQKDFAELCAITPSYLSQIESNSKEPNLSTLKIISEKLEVPLPIIFFLALDKNDIKVEKREMYHHLGPTIKSMLGEFFGNISISHD